MIPDIQELNFPSYATLSNATPSIKDMDECTIATTINIDGDIAPDFSYDWAVVFLGHKYVLPIREPHGTKDTSDTRSQFEVTFKHWAIDQLQSYLFVELTSIASGTAIADNYVTPLSLNLYNFCIVFKQELDYYFGDSITLDLNPAYEYKAEPSTIEISNAYIWDVLIKFYELFGVRWQIEPNGSYDKYVIRVGYPVEDLSHQFEYGFKGGLLSTDRQVQSDDIKNILIGRGGDTNLPLRYFKDIDDNNPLFEADPDWIPELRNIYFSELRNKNFRDYVKGWKTNPYRMLTEEDGSEIIDKTSGEAIQVEEYDEEYAKTSWAYIFGHTDEKFKPTEYVADKLEVNDGEVRTVENSSLDRYGEKWGRLENNEDIYPTIQGISVDPYGRIDQAIEVEQVTTDDTNATTDNSAERVRLGGATGYDPSVGAGNETTITTDSINFTVSSGRVATIGYESTLLRSGNNAQENDNFVLESTWMKVYERSTYKEVSSVNIPSGNYYAVFGCKVQNNATSAQWITFDVKEVFMITRDENPDTWSDAFCVWIKNIWLTTKEEGETDSVYASRVWNPILGDRLGNEAMLNFSTGFLSTSEDYEFTILKVAYDNTKTLVDKDAEGNILGTYQSEWKLTLAKCDADLDTLGVYIPSTQRQGNAGDYFYFTGIDMPHLYTLWAEQSLKDDMEDSLEESANISNTWVIGLDKVRIGRKLFDDAEALISQLKIGAQIKLADKRFIKGVEYLYIQEISYTYAEPTDEDPYIVPDIELTLSNDYSTEANEVQTLSAEVSALRAQIGSVSNVESIVTKVGNKKYLRKDQSDYTPYSLEVGQELNVGGETTLSKGLTSKSFAEGETGYGYNIDSNGNAWLQSLSLREFLSVPEIRYNRTEVISGIEWNAPGGGIIESVEQTSDTEGIVTLKLEDGEIGAISTDDLCMGIWHFAEGNATADSDNGKGLFTFAGFSTIYFRITSCGSDNSTFAYTLRDGYARHPQVGMHFVGFGNITNKDRQKSKYATRSYTRYLANVDSWEFTEAMIMAQIGDLSGLVVDGVDMSGYSAFLNNIYFSGVIQQIQRAPLVLSLYAKNDPYVGGSRTCQVEVSLMKGYEKVSWDSVSWVLTTDSGATVPSIKDGILTLDSSILNGKTSTMVTFVATLEQDGNSYSDTASISIRDVSELKGAAGTNGTNGKDGSSYTTNLLINSGAYSNYGWRIYNQYDLNINGISTEETYNGNNSFILKSVGVSSTQGYFYVQYVRLDNTEATKLTVSGWLKIVSSLGNGYCYFGFNFYKEDKTTSFNSEGKQLTIRGDYTNNDWQFLKGSFDIPEGAYYARFFFFLKGDGEVYLNSPKLEYGANDNPVWTPNSTDLDVVGYTENLLTNSKTMVGDLWQKESVATLVENAVDDFTSCKVETGTTYSNMMVVNYTPEVGKTYTVSFYARGEAISLFYLRVTLTQLGSNGDIYPVSSSSSSSMHWYNLSETEWKRCWLTFTVDELSTTGRIYILLRCPNTDSTAEFYGLKVEEGVNQQPIWTPNNTDNKGADGHTPTIVSDGNGNILVDDVSIGNFKGDTGTAGRGEVSRIRYYAVNNSATTAPTYPTIASTSPSSLTWKTTPQTPTYTNRYHWSYERIQYSSGTTWEQSTPSIIGVYGEQGVQGVTGAITRIRGEYDNDTEYCDGSSESGGAYYKDVVWITQNGARTYFTCIKRCTNIIPMSTDSWQTYWQQLSNIASLYTDLLLAPNARIDFLSGQEIVLGDSEGNVTARLGGGNVIMWSGGDSEESATFTLDKDGKTRYGLASGQRIELDPNSKNMRIFNADGVQCAQYSGEVNTEDILGGAETWTTLSAKGSVSGYDNSDTTSSVASIKTSSGGRSTIQLTLSVSCNSSWQSSGSTTELAQYCERGAYTKCWVEDSSGNIIAQDSVSTISNSSDTSTLTKQVTFNLNLSIDTYTLKVQMQTSGNGRDSNSVGRVSAESSYSNLSTSDSSSSNYMASYFANGFCLADLSNDYMLALYDSTDGFTVSAENKNGFGIRIDKDGVYTRNYGSRWMGMPFELFYMRIATNASYGVVSCWDAESLPSVQNYSGGYLVINIPTIWVDKLQLSYLNMRIEVMGRGTTVATGIASFPNYVSTASDRNMLHILTNIQGTQTNADLWLRVSYVPNDGMIATSLSLDDD